MKRKKSCIYLIALLLISGLSVYPQGLNQIIEDPETGNEILYGYCDTEGFLNDPFVAWYELEHENYLVDHVALGELNTDLFYMSDITVVMGTWCSDSQREVPRFLKIIEELGMDLNIINMICVDRSKQADVPELTELQIELVPTIIFYIDEDEVGRIIETPLESLEADIVSIFQ